MSEISKGWRIASARTMYDNPWIRIRQYDAVAPTNAPALYGLVEFKNLATGVLPIEPDGTTYLVGQHRFVNGKYEWELPEGGGPLDMDPRDAAARELAEETGLRGASWRPILEDVYLSNSVTDERAYAYFAWDLSPTDAGELDASEALDVKRLPWGDALQMAVAGEISDAFSLVMLLKADHLLRNGALPDDLAEAMRRGL